MITISCVEWIHRQICWCSNKGHYHHVLKLFQEGMSKPGAATYRPALTRRVRVSLNIRNRERILQTRTKQVNKAFIETSCVLHVIIPYYINHKPKSFSLKYTYELNRWRQIALFGMRDVFCFSWLLDFVCITVSTVQSCDLINEVMFMDTPAISRGGHVDTVHL